MGILEDLSSGKYNLVLFGIIFVFMFHQYWCTSTRQSQEPMADVSNDIKEAVKQVYLADVEAIRNLSEIATKINAGTFVFPGNLNVTGQIKANSSINAGGEIGNNSQSLASLNSKIDSVSSSLTNNINNQISNVNSKISSNYSNLEAKINEFDSEYLWGSAPDSSTWRCRKPCDTGNWQRMPGGLSIISQGKKYLWGSAPDSSTWRCLKPCDTGNWQRIPGGLRVITATGAD
jgi:hypothetical protein